jgi:hypothetical protein
MKTIVAVLMTLTIATSAMAGLFNEAAVKLLEASPQEFNEKVEDMIIGAYSVIRVQLVAKGIPIEEYEKLKCTLSPEEKRTIIKSTKAEIYKPDGMQFDTAVAYFVISHCGEQYKQKQMEVKKK